MEHDPSSFLVVSAIDWQRIARACTFYTQKGYKYLEVPWAVSQDVLEATAPPGAHPVRVSNSKSILIGSAEQGFLAVLDQMTMFGIYFSVSPCFRGEPKFAAGHTQISFMKVELFALYTDDAQQLRTDAAEFMEKEGAVVQTVDTLEGTDLLCANIEVGSYGVRTWKGKLWSYGTGLAEPRFTTALAVQRRV